MKICEKRLTKSIQKYAYTSTNNNIENVKKKLFVSVRN